VIPIMICRRAPVRVSQIAIPRPASPPALSALTLRPPAGKDSVRERGRAKLYWNSCGAGPPDSPLTQFPSVPDATP
jgi:hypothetical protein